MALSTKRKPGANYLEYKGMPLNDIDRSTVNTSHGQFRHEPGQMSNMVVNSFHEKVLDLEVENHSRTKGRKNEKEQDHFPSLKIQHRNLNFTCLCLILSVTSLSMKVNKTYSCWQKHTREMSLMFRMNSRMKL